LEKYKLDYYQTLVMVPMEESSLLGSLNGLVQNDKFQRTVEKVPVNCYTVTLKWLHNNNLV
jgi:hypothetical protein